MCPPLRPKGRPKKRVSRRSKSTRRFLPSPRLCRMIRERMMRKAPGAAGKGNANDQTASGGHADTDRARVRSEEHTSELQSRENLVCRLLLEKKKQEKTG